MTQLPVLSAVDQRILGSLLEKERTVPASYPLTLNALRTACNQSSSRDPVVSYDDALVEQTCRDLKERGLLRIVWADRGPRTLKYHQVVAELLDLAEDERALLTVLLLRGPQAAGELRTRSERLHPFADRGDVETCLERMASASPPLVRQLPRRAGERDPRWVHLLGETPGSTAGESATPAVDIDPARRDEQVRTAYADAAVAYADALVDELDALPMERWLLDRVVGLADGAPMVEVGCGPGHVTAYLAGRGATATGLDLVPAMVEEARRRFPHATYDVGDLRRLMRPPAADGWGAVLAWYSLVHTPPAELPETLAALVRPLRPGGWLVYAGHAGREVQHHDELFGVDVDLDVVHHEPADVAALFAQAGLADVEWYRRSPVAARGESTERGYVLGRLPLLNHLVTDRDRPALEHPEHGAAAAPQRLLRAGSDGVVEQLAQSRHPHDLEQHVADPEPGPGVARHRSVAERHVASRQVARHLRPEHRRGLVEVLPALHGDVAVLRPVVAVPPRSPSPPRRSPAPSPASAAAAPSRRGWRRRSGTREEYPRAVVAAAGRWLRPGARSLAVDVRWPGQERGVVRLIASLGDGDPPLPVV
ncbi:DUF480 domain-containing protein [Nocardioides sp. TF02-7]|uniref:DUF480 domain-containing protein n=1 Tax=Nocardioides sp. TF02-7 TaxID=2917724 RepID=UPI001F06F4AA|nr:DUF480 domain-containing protein [Nocardioides sp. TF02-7]UMG92335.1 DUF480 domain-containing protein [Nocardioides sp. TF02-7]